MRLFNITEIEIKCRRQYTALSRILIHVKDVGTVHITQNCYVFLLNQKPSTETEI